VIPLRGNCTLEEQKRLIDALVATVFDQSDFVIRIMKWTKAWD